MVITPSRNKVVKGIGISSNDYKEQTHSTRSNYEILRILSVGLLDKTALKELVSNPTYQDNKEQNYI